MPNWCNAKVVIEGKSAKDVEAFCKHFIYEGEEGKKGETGERYFARTFSWMTWEDFKKEYLGKRCAEVGVDFAWSAYSCLIGGYVLDNKDGKLISLSEACKLHKVSVVIDSQEPGCCFEEHIECDDKGKILADECYEMPTYKCECGNVQNIPSSYDPKYEECYECEKTGRWTLEEVKKEC